MSYENYSREDLIAELGIVRKKLKEEEESNGVLHNLMVSAERRGEGKVQDLLRAAKVLIDDMLSIYRPDSKTVTITGERVETWINERSKL